MSYNFARNLDIFKLCKYFYIFHLMPHVNEKVENNYLSLIPDIPKSLRFSGINKVCVKLSIPKVVKTITGLVSITMALKLCHCH